jgi:hypothetical protein
MKTHAECCPLLKHDKFGTNLLEDVLAIHQLRAAQQTNSQNIPITPSVPPLKRARTTTGLLSFGETQSLNAGTQLEFSKDFLKLLIANGAPFLFANNPETRIFADKWITPGAVIPDRKKLSGQILDDEVKMTEDRVKLKVQGKVSTGQCDGWKNNAKKSVVSTMVTVENEVSHLLETGFNT